MFFLLLLVLLLLSQELLLLLVLLLSSQEHVERASTVLSQSVATIDRFRRKTQGIADSLGKMVRKQVDMTFSFSLFNVSLIL